jgi:hypothetical protein
MAKTGHQQPNQSCPITPRGPMARRRFGFAAMVVDAGSIL